MESIFAAGSIGALDFSVRIVPNASIPLSDTPGTPSLYSLGVGATAYGAVELFNFFAPGLDFGINYIPTLNTGGGLTMTNIGLDAGAFYSPISRIKLRAFLGSGLYLLNASSAADSGASADQSSAQGQTSASINSGYSWYWKMGLEAGFRFSPALTLSLTGGLSQYRLATVPLYTGFNLGLSADIDLSALSSTGSGIQIRNYRTDPVFSTFYRDYSNKAIGSITLYNGEQSEIQNVVVSFQAGGFTAGPKVAATIDYMAKGKSVDIPVYADFSDQVLSLTDDTKVQADISVSYKLLGTPRVSHTTETVRINHRNAISWIDPEVLSVLVSGTDPSVLEFTKFIAGIVRNNIRDQIEKNLQYAMGLFEGIRLTGVVYAPDAATPYSTYHLDKTLTDYVQYPYQTLSYKSGDSDDISVLMAASLLSVGLESALIIYKKEAAVAVLLSMDEAAARSTFSDPDSLIYRDGRVWLPIQVSKIREGFLSAWQGGIQQWQAAVASGDNPVFYDIEDGWKLHPAVGLPPLDAQIAKPADDAVTKAFESSLTRFVAKEVEPKAQKLLADMIPGQTTDRQYNSLGILYARYGMIDEARAQFEKAAANKYLPSLTNLGNIEILQKRFDDASQVYNTVLSIQPDNKIALVGLAQAQYELSNFQVSDALITRVQALDPKLAESYSYLLSKTAKQ